MGVSGRSKVKNKGMCVGCISNFKADIVFVYMYTRKNRSWGIDKVRPSTINIVTVFDKWDT